MIRIAFAVAFGSLIFACVSAPSKAAPVAPLPAGVVTAAFSLRRRSQLTSAAPPLADAGQELVGRRGMSVQRPPAAGACLFGRTTHGRVCHRLRAHG